jgi:hypothetical protein
LHAKRGLEFVEQQPNVAAVFLTEVDGKPQTQESAVWKKLTFDKAIKH